MVLAAKTTKLGVKERRNAKSWVPSVIPAFDVSQIEAVKRCLMKYATEYRDYLLSQDYIYSIDGEIDNPWYLLAVDSASFSIPLGGGVHLLLSGVCNDLERMIAQDVKTYVFANNMYVDAFATLARLALEFDLIARLPLVMNTYVILDHSFNRIPIELNQILYEMIAYGESLWNKDNDDFYQIWHSLMDATFGPQGNFLKVINEKRIIAVTKENTSRYMLTNFQSFLESKGECAGVIRSIGNLNDKTLMQCILQPGEYLLPQVNHLGEKKTPYRVNIFRHSYNHIIDFVPLEHEFHDCQILSTYFLPKPDTSIQRIEYSEGSDINAILSTLRYYCLPHIPEIIQQARADEYAKFNLQHLNQKHQEKLMKLVGCANNIKEGNLYKLLLSPQRS